MRNLGNECSLRSKKETLWICNLKMNLNLKKNVYVSFKKNYILSQHFRPGVVNHEVFCDVLMIFKCRCIQWIFKFRLFIFFKLTFQCSIQSKVKLTFSLQTIYNFERFYIMVNIHIIIRFTMIYSFLFFVLGWFWF